MLCGTFKPREVAALPDHQPLVMINGGSRQPNRLVADLGAAGLVRQCGFLTPFIPLLPQGSLVWEPAKIKIVSTLATGTVAETITEVTHPNGTLSFHACLDLCQQRPPVRVITARSLIHRFGRLIERVNRKHDLPFRPAGPKIDEPGRNGDNASAVLRARSCRATTGGKERGRQEAELEIPCHGERG